MTTTRINPPAMTLVLRDGSRVEYEIFQHPHHQQPIFDALATWLQDVTLDDAVNLWWRAQKRKQEKAMHMRRTAYRGEKVTA